MDLTEEYNHRHRSVRDVLRHFDAEHLPEMTLINHHCKALAVRMVDLLPDDPELVVGLRKLLEAKEAFSRTLAQALGPLPRPAAMAAGRTADRPDGATEGLPAPVAASGPEVVSKSASPVLDFNLQGGVWPIQPNNPGMIRRTPGEPGEPFTKE